MVRDSRAVAYAWQKHKLQPDGGDSGEEMGRMRPWFSSMLWNVWNVSAEIMSTQKQIDYHRLSWEKFVSAPQTEFKKLIQGLNLTAGVQPFHGEHSAILGIDHTVSGNPNRFNNGEIDIHTKEEWRGKFSDLNMGTVGLLTAPLMLRYGYMRKPATIPDAPVSS